jgi:hypothetical protein
LPDKTIISQLQEIKELRNDIAHTGNTSDDDDILLEFIGRLRLANKWIQGIEQWQRAKEDLYKERRVS